MDVDKLIRALDDLTPDQRARVEAHLAAHQSTSQTDADAWAAALDAAIAEFREGLSEEDIDEIAAAMTAKHVRPEDFE